MRSPTNMFGRPFEKSAQVTPPSQDWYTPKSAATQTRLAFQGSTSTAFIGRAGSPAVRSVHVEPPSTELKTRPPPIVRYVAQTRFVLLGSAYRSLTTALARGVVSAVR